MLATDLDQTLVFSPGAAARGPDRSSRVVEVLDGRTISLLSTRTERDLLALNRVATVVPVTTRTRAQFQRLDLPSLSRWAVVASGAGILVDGEPDAGWACAVAARLAQAAEPLSALQAVFEGWDGHPWLLRVRMADGVFLVAQVEASLLVGDALAEVTARCAALGWRAVHQGRKLYVLPGGLSKAAAVAEVCARAGADTLLAAGDTELDWEMLALAEHGWVPAGSELDRLGRTAPHLSRTREGGLAAAEQIVADALVLVTAPRDVHDPARTVRDTPSH